MTIKAGVGLDTVAITASDTSLVVPADPQDRVEITMLTLYNSSGASRVVEFYSSSDATSASGEQIAQVSMAADETVIVPELIGLGLAQGSNLIAKNATGDGVVASITITEFTGGS